MAFRIPDRQSKSFIVNSFRGFRGNIERTFNTCLVENPGKIRTTRLKINTSENDESDLDQPADAFAYFDSEYWLASSTDVFRSNTVSGSSPDDPFSEDATTGTPETSRGNTDMAVFNDNLYISTDTGIHKKSTGNWSNPVTGLTAFTKTLLEPFGDRLYYTDNDVFVGSINTSDVKATTANTLDLKLPNSSTTGKYEITMLRAGNNQLWIGTNNNYGASNYVYSWNGETEDTFTARYEIGVGGVLAGIVRKETNTPIILDSRGRVMAFNGSGFTEVGRIDVNGERLRRDLIHYNGIIETEDEVLFLISPGVDSGSSYPQAPAGIWAYSEENGFYHKYSVSQQAMADTGNTNLIDYGAYKINDPGALFYAQPSNGLSNGTLLASAEIYTDPTTDIAAVLINDSYDTTDKFGSFTTRWLEAKEVQSQWKDICVKHKTLLNSTDFIELFYRREELDSVHGSATITGRKEIQIADSDMAIIKTRFDKGMGHDVTVVLGNSAGFSASISDISLSGSTYILTLDRDLPKRSGSTEIIVENWEKIRSQEDQIEQFTKGGANNASTKIQIKVNMKWTGKGEVEEVLVSDQDSEKLN